MRLVYTDSSPPFSIWWGNNNSGRVRMSPPAPRASVARPRQPRARDPEVARHRLGAHGCALVPLGAAPAHSRGGQQQYRRRKERRRERERERHTHTHRSRGHIRSGPQPIPPPRGWAAPSAKLHTLLSLLHTKLMTH